MPTPFTVGDLIARLQTFDPTLPVVILNVGEYGEEYSEPSTSLEVGYCYNGRKVERYNRGYIYGSPSDKDAKVSVVCIR